MEWVLYFAFIEQIIDPLQDNEVVFIKATKALDHSSADRYGERWLLQGAKVSEVFRLAKIESKILDTLRPRT